MSKQAVNNAHTAKQIFIISEAIDGRIVETRLPKDQAHKLHQKLISAGANVSIKEESIMDYIDDEVIKQTAINLGVPEYMLRPKRLTKFEQTIKGMK